MRETVNTGGLHTFEYRSYPERELSPKEKEAIDKAYKNHLKKIAARLPDGSLVDPKEWAKPFSERYPTLDAFIYLIGIVAVCLLGVAVLYYGGSFLLRWLGL